jgi:phage gp29-like protein
MGIMSWLAARFSRSQMIAPIPIVAPPALYLQHTMIGGGLSPREISAIYNNADNGRQYQLKDLWNECRQKDGHLQSVCGTRELGVKQLVTTDKIRGLITPASDDKQDKFIAEWCQDWLANFGADVPVTDGEEPKDLRRMVGHLVGGGVFGGYGVTETLFGRDGKYVIPIGCEPIAPRRFAFDLDHGRLHFWDEFGPVTYPGTRLLEAFPGRFVQHQPRTNGDVEGREGLDRVLIWLSFFSNYGLKDWLQLAELAWKPWRIGYYERTADLSASQHDRAALERALQTLTTNGVASLPSTVKLAIEWAKNKGEAGHAQLLANLNAEKSKVVLGQTLTVEQGRVGSQALGKVHNEVRHDIRDDDAGEVSATIRRHLIAPVVRLNFGKVKIPGFEIKADEVVDLQTFSVGVKNLSDAGTAIPANWVRGRVGIPDPKPGDELVGGGVYVGDDAALAKSRHEQRKAA